MSSSGDLLCSAEPKFESLDDAIGALESIVSAPSLDQSRQSGCAAMGAIIGATGRVGI